ncbi:MAG: chromosome segregation protein SMC [Hyphomicrobiales bacterium]|nr:chromosome segregation protein SMC [Hyphomicrobiales bacterium]
MKLTRLRLTGFKSFVEATEFQIEPGLSGIVGPNGCGKSNLVEALRWVMGENSFKNMRGSGMDDVIFAGSGSRPARNVAEVGLTLDNAARTAPSQFNDAEVLEVTRRIEREEGSTYRVNGKEVRARDVQLLFADAATGARSPALVRQGQISEIIAAKPQSRRRILEDAAGIAGLHSRRHEAELRLRAAEDNLLRLEDVLREIESQIEALKRQARQAGRYKLLAAEIRSAEALLAAITYRDARDQAAVAERAAEAALRDVAEATRIQAETARHQAVAAHALPQLRDAEAGTAAAMARLRRALDELEADDRRSRQRAEEVSRRIAELSADLAREAGVTADAEASLARLADELTSLAAAGSGSEAARAEALALQAAAETALADAEAAQGAAQTAMADLNARKSAFERALRDAVERAARHRVEREGLERSLVQLDAESGLGAALDALRSGLAAAETGLHEADEAAAAARARLSAARDAEQKARVPQVEADRKAQRLETEVRTLQKLLSGPANDLWPPVLEQIAVQKGYETALGAALGDDLDASSNPSAPAHWRETGAAASDPPLPGDVEPLSAKVRAPAAMLRRLNQIGVVTRSDGARLMAQLHTGQRLVSREGDLWRWDGFVAAAEAPTPAARRLAEKNRLGDLEREAQAAREAAEAAREALDAAQAMVRQSAVEEAAAIEAARDRRRRFDQARDQLATAERRITDMASRRASLAEGVGRLAASEAEAGLARDQAEAGLASLRPSPELETALAAASARVSECRSAAVQARSAVQTLQREQTMRAERSAAAEADMARWRERIARSEAARAEADKRRDVARLEAEALADAPDTFLVRRRELLAAIEEADAKRRSAADDLARAQTLQAEADKAARIALDALAGVREARAAAEARLEAARTRLDDVSRAIADTLATTPAGLHELAGLKPGDELPPAGETERRLANLKGDRERLGAVNLRADEELAEIEAKREQLVAERDDLSEAIRRLRQAIGSLNREGRERLLAAFDLVNGHFKRLFGVLFGGGEAELTLVDSEDPLEAGLEILARPPGKKPQTMTLLSGGEQALTATALIFAVFLTNPSPICVLDEVDAPLDDANVERYCDLLRDMVTQTETRFVVITHNPITMARMDRLFGVTMAERGVSQLVSVDLETAEAIRDAV